MSVYGLFWWWSLWLTSAATFTAYFILRFSSIVGCCSHALFFKWVFHVFVYRSQRLIYIYTLSQTLPVFSIPRPALSMLGLTTGSQTWMPTHNSLTILRTDHHLVRSELRQKHKKPKHINLTKIRTDNIKTSTEP